jgi:hypothetical protein
MAGALRSGLVTLLALVASPSAGGTAEMPRVIVDYDRPSVSVAAHDVPLADVLSRIAEVVGFEVSGAEIRQPISVNVQQLTIEETLGHVLSQDSYALVYRAETAPGRTTHRLDRVILLGRRGPGHGIAGDRTAYRGSIIAVDTEPPATVSDMLAAHAMSSIAAADAAALGPPPSAAASPTAEVLAAMTRRAQEGLTAIVQALKTAADILQRPPDDDAH